ncbi:MAG: hypothetical protein GC159_13950 [Phycisphaera sp.]|nr:hypothetical protein [Phycisphaera sp.]
MRIPTTIIAVLLLSVATVFGAPEDYFAIEVVDADTGRGVPLVELETVNNIRYVTDSNGLIAFNEPGLMNQRVFFSVRSHGYEAPKDGFGITGKAFDIKPGGSATIKLKRINIAERLYRITGGGIYRDSVLLGRDTPIKHPVLNAQVLGQDSTLNAVYQGKVWWFWGDTNRPAYPLGHFRMSGATSKLPADGGLDPSKGVELNYFVDDSGFARAMAPFPEVKKGLYWLNGFFVLPDETGRERMISHYNHMESLYKRLDHGLAIFNDDTQAFEQLRTLDDKEDLHPEANPFDVTIGGKRYVYFPEPYPVLRVRAEWAAVQDPAQYESFTCLKPGTRWDGAGKPEVERDENGHVKWAWKANTSWLDRKREQALIDAGKLKSDEAWCRTVDAASGKPIVLHFASVAWNEFRKKYVMITVQIGGTSMLGEYWYAEADAPEGPYRKAVKIVTHDKYAFYNPRHHPYFDQQGGRLIYFEGTYTQQFSGATEATPRYDYNQIMYRLDLSDPRLKAAQE